MYSEGRNFNSIAVTVQGRLTKFIGAKSTQDPFQIEERDRLYWATPFVPSANISLLRYMPQYIPLETREFLF